MHIYVMLTFISPFLHLLIFVLAVCCILRLLLICNYGNYVNYSIVIVLEMEKTWKKETCVTYVLNPVAPCFVS